MCESELFIQLYSKAIAPNSEEPHLLGSSYPRKQSQLPHTWGISVQKWWEPQEPHLPGRQWEGQAGMMTLLPSVSG